MQELQIGKSIGRARRAQGLTQEQLGGRLGVSAGAVSKWETGSALPDIALLAPLARALNLSLDALLDYEPELTGQAYADQVKVIEDAFVHRGAVAGREQLYKALQTYPNNGGLKILGAKNIRMTATTEQERAEALEEALALYREARDLEAGRFRQAALFGMAEIYLSQGRHEESRACLTALAEGGGFDPMLLYPRLLIEQEQWEEAAQACKGQLLQYLNAATAMVAQLAYIAERQDDVAGALFFLEKQQAVEELFGVGLCMACLALARHHLRQEQLREAAAWFLRYVEGVAAYPLNYGGHPVFDGVRLQADEAAQLALRQTLLRELGKNETYAPLSGQPAYRQALRRISEFTDGPPAPG